MSEMNFLIKPASGLCNLRCDYCFYADEMNSRKQASYGMMPDKVMEQVIKKALAKATKKCTFLFQGGEPTLVGLPFYEKWMSYEKNITRTMYKYHMRCKQTDTSSRKTGAVSLPNISF